MAENLNLVLQIVPDHVFNSAIWAIPSAVGVVLIIVHLRRIDVVGRGVGAG